MDIFVRHDQLIIIVNVQPHENAIRKEPQSHYRAEAVLDGFQLSNFSTYLDPEHPL